MDILELRKQLASFGQEHVVNDWDELSGSQRDTLVAQLGEIDLEQIAQLVARRAPEEDVTSLAKRAEPPPAKRLSEAALALPGGETCDPASALATGQAGLAAGKLGVVLTAGGQGTRLGFDKPKGMYPIGPISGATLLQIHCEKLQALARRYQVAIPLYLMTSPATHAATVTFLEDHQFFGLSSDDVFVFCQGTMPAVDAENGKLLLSARDSLALSPDGHGGTLAALVKSGALADVRKRGIEHLFYFQIDNPLSPVCDAELIGYHLAARSEFTSVAVAKHAPQDRVGNFVSIDGRLQVVEYIDFPEDVASRRDSGGSLVFWAGSIAVHVFDVAFLERAANEPDALPFHFAHKAVPYLNEDGELVRPSSPNALKFERFIFDLLPSAQRPIVVEFDEHEVFAPLKNAAGAPRDTPEFVATMLFDRSRRLLRAVGARVSDDARIEISPLYALDEADLAERIAPGQEFHEPCYLTVP